METTQHEPVMKADPQREHEWLRRLVGEWTYDAVAQAPGQPPDHATGTETVRSLGDIWFVAEADGEMPGGDRQTWIMSLGYDPQKGRFVGSWIGSMMHNLWVYEGWLDDQEKVLTLESAGPSFSDSGKLGRYRDVIEFKNDDHRVQTSLTLNDANEWQQFMTSQFRRRK